MPETQAEPPSSALFGVKYSYDWIRKWRYVIVQPSVKNVGLSIASFANKRGLQVFPGIKRLSAMTGHSRSTVIDALGTMRYLGFLWRKSSGQGWSNERTRWSAERTTPGRLSGPLVVVSHDLTNT